MAISLPTPLRVAAGIVASGIDLVRSLPEEIPALPVTLIGRAMQLSMKVQQEIADLATKGDELIGGILGRPQENPPWARFDDEPPTAAVAARARTHESVARAGAAATRVAEGGKAPVVTPLARPYRTAPKDSSASSHTAGPTQPAGTGSEGQRPPRAKPPAAVGPSGARATTKSPAKPATKGIATSPTSAPTDDDSTPTDSGPETGPETGPATEPETAGTARPLTSESDAAARNEGPAGIEESADGDEAATTSTPTSVPDSADDPATSPETGATDGLPNLEQPPAAEHAPPPDTTEAEHAPAPDTTEAEYAPDGSTNGQSPSSPAPPTENGPAALPDYDRMTLAQVRGYLRSLSAAEVASLLSHEQTGENRAPFLTLLSNRLVTLEHRES